MPFLFYSSSFNMQVLLYILGFVFLVSVVMGMLRMSWWAFFIPLSLLGNTVLCMNLDMRMFNAYHIPWMENFSLYIWPILNIILIASFFLRKKLKKLLS